ncbi:ACKR1 protein, partial [Anseranas semipalmata]|nr:ACKR1 protein [Anseranas semipalmata]
PSQRPEVLENKTSLDFLDILANLTDSEDYLADLDYAAAEPCHNHYCPFFQRAAPTFLAVTCTAAVLATGALLVALAKRPNAWPHSRALVAQLAVGTGLFAALLPPVAAGIGQGWRLGAGACKVTQLLWHWSIFAQGLLVGSGCCSGAWSRWDPRGAPQASCVRRSVEVLSPAYLLHLAFCLCVFLLLPAALLVATLVQWWQRTGWGTGDSASWLFFVLWAPYGAGLAVDFLLHAGLLQPTCSIFEWFDYALGLCEGLGVLHCCLGPPALLAAGLC